MKKLFLPLILLTIAATGSQAQITATFEALPLPGSDTFYVNHSAPGEDVGFLDNEIYFPAVFDEFSGTWYQSNGFVYSNRTDSATVGLAGQYTAVAGGGDAGSLQYAVAYFSDFADNYIALQGGARGRVLNGVSITNNSYAYHSMRDGDFVGKKFGGPTGADPDFFKVIFYGYLDGVQKPDSVEFYLADFRFTDNSLDYIVKTWEWVNLSAIGAVDSITYKMASSDMGEWGINTPLYFCIDNLYLGTAPSGVAQAGKTNTRVFPNPARQFVTVENTQSATYRLTDLPGRQVAAGNFEAGKNQFSVAHLPAGTYLLSIRNGQQQETIRVHVQ